MVFVNDHKTIFFIFGIIFAVVMFVVLIICIMMTVACNMDDMNDDGPNIDVNTAALENDLKEGVSD